MGREGLKSSKFKRDTRQSLSPDPLRALAGLPAAGSHLSALGQEALNMQELDREWVSLQHSLVQLLRKKREKRFPWVKALPETAADFGQGH